MLVMLNSEVVSNSQTWIGNNDPVYIEARKYNLLPSEFICIPDSKLRVKVNKILNFDTYLVTFEYENLS